jgi:hypothetical protein
MIYFLAAHTNQRIKIGTADDPLSRLRGLQAGAPWRSRLMATMPGNRADELVLHRRFAFARAQGEWFRVSTALVQLITRHASPPIPSGAPPLTPAFNDLARLEPQLQRLLLVARMTVDWGTTASFCAHDVWYGDDGLRERVSQLAGWDAVDRRLRSEAVYDLVYDTIYEALPHCRNCHCAGGGL